MTRQIVLTGFMGAGKSSAAKRIAARLGRKAVDIDHAIEIELDKPIDQIFADDGEAVFREHEAKAIERELAASDPAVIALGGGALGSESVRSALRAHLVVYLEVDADLAWRRVRGSQRPLAQTRESFFELLEGRRAVYEDAADATVPNDRTGTPDAVASWLGRLVERPPGTKMLWAAGSGWSYPAIFEPGVLDRNDLWAVPTEHLTVADQNLAKIFDWLNDGLIVPPGESSKTVAQVEQLAEAMARREITRHDTVVAVGGGVVGDLAGFTAAVYQRGIPFVQVPTSVVAQVDSAYGGKTGVDLPAAKNYVGAYHQPSAVIVDTEVLAKLPRAELISGYAEVIKTALISGGRLWSRVAAGVDLTAPFDPWIVFECARTKLAVVAADERDSSLRQILNLGHTIGHAIESAAGYGAMRHGEAVAVGMLGALRLSGQDALRAQVNDLTVQAGLPTTATGVDVDDVLARLRLDKKREGDSVPFVLVEKPGEVTPGHLVPQADIRSAVVELIK